MDFLSLQINPGLFAGSRLRNLSSSESKISTLELVLLLMAGATSALASGLLDFSLKIPGHAILRVILPTTLGLSLVPRNGAGSVMAASAFTTAILLRATSVVPGYGIGALTSLLLTGPILDFTLRSTNQSYWIYINCSFAGLLSNSLAMAVRGFSKWMEWERVGRAPIEIWMSRAAISYPICGLLAGLLCAMIWFSIRTTEQNTKGER